MRSITIFYRDWRIDADDTSATGTMINGSGERFECHEQPAFEEALRAAKAKVDRIEGIQTWDQNYTKGICCVVDQFCLAAANFDPLRYVKTRCFACGDFVCENCSVETDYHNHGKVRLCHNCRIDYDGSREAVIDHLHELAGYPARGGTMTTNNVSPKGTARGLYDHTAIIHGFVRKCLDYFNEEFDDGEREQLLEEDLPEYAETIITGGGYDLDQRIATLQAENDALQNLTARTTEALQSLTVISERRHEMVTDLQAENERLRLLVKRTIDAGSQLFSDPGLDKNWHWKGYLLELDQIVVAGREALKELGE